uniref:Uncharacterized protein n=1 Tax=Cacopsylla melanoneura TaxID=428564 RepID=A0A8D8SH88_9HEMI
MNTARGRQHARRMTPVRGRCLAVENCPVGRRSDALLIDFAFLFRVSYMQSGRGSVRYFFPVREGYGGRQVQTEVVVNRRQTDLTVPLCPQLSLHGDRPTRCKAQHRKGCVGGGGRIPGRGSEVSYDAGDKTQSGEKSGEDENYCGHCFHRLVASRRHGPRKWPRQIQIRLTSLNNTWRSGP